MAVLQLLRKAPLMVRHTICQQVISILHQNPPQVATIAQSAGWESLFLWLLTPFDSTGDEMEASCERQLEVFGSEGSGEKTRDGKSDEGEGKSGEADGTSGEKDGKSDEGEKSGEADGKSSEKDGKSDEEDWMSGEPPQVEVTSPKVEMERSRSEASSKRRNACPGPPSTRAVSVSVMSTYGFTERDEEAKRRSLTYASSWSAAIEEASDEIWRTFAVVTETIGYILWHSVDYDSDKPPWKVRGRVLPGGVANSTCHIFPSMVQVWGKFFSSLDHFSSRHTLVVPAHTIKHRWS